jgi:hypothetical protein
MLVNHAFGSHTDVSQPPIRITRVAVREAAGAPKPELVDDGGGSEVVTQVLQTGPSV